MKICSDVSVANCVRMTWSMPAAVPQMMMCLIKLMKHTVTCSLLSFWRRVTWLGEHLFLIMWLLRYWYITLRRFLCVKLMNCKIMKFSSFLMPTFMWQSEWPLTVLDFKVTIFFKVRYLRNGTRQRYTYNGRLLASRTWSIKCYNFQWPWLTPNASVRSMQSFEV